MPLVPAKCPECGGLVEVDNEKRAGLCQHCGQPFVVEDAIQTFNTYYQTTNNYNTTHNYGDGAVVNVYEDKSKDFVIEAGVLKAYRGANTDVIIPDNVFEICDGVFSGMGITSITFSKNVTKIGSHAFTGCDKLKLVDYAGALEDWMKIEFQSNPNSYAQNLYLHGEPLSKEVYIPDTILHIGNYTFDGCSQLTSVVISHEITDIGFAAFKNCTSLVNIVLPNGMKGIDDQAFYGCVQLTQIKIPNTVETIGKHAFQNCMSLQELCVSDSLCDANLVCNAVIYNYTKTKIFQLPQVFMPENFTIPDSVESMSVAAFEIAEKYKHLYWKEQDLKNIPCQSTELIKLVTKRNFPYCIKHNYMNGKCTICHEYDCKFPKIYLPLDDSKRIGAVVITLVSERKAALSLDEGRLVHFLDIDSIDKGTRKKLENIQVLILDCLNISGNAFEFTCDAAEFDERFEQGYKRLFRLFPNVEKLIVEEDTGYYDKTQKYHSILKELIESFPHYAEITFGDQVPMKFVDLFQKEKIIRRAKNRCQYCGGKFTFPIFGSVGDVRCRNCGRKKDY